MRAAGWVLRSALRAASSTPAGPGRQAALQCGTQDAARLTTGQAWSSALLQQQRAWFGAGRVGDEELEEGLVVPKVPRKPGTKTKPKNQDEELPPKPEHEAHAQRLAAQERIRLLLQAEGAEADRGNEAAEQFVQSFFAAEGPRDEDLDAGAAVLDVDVPTPHGDDEDDDGLVRVSSSAELTAEEEDALLAGLKGMKSRAQRVMLNKLLRGGILENDPQARREWAAIQRRFEPPSGFRMRVVDVNRTSKGTKAGGLYRFGAMVVVGNGEGVLGWGQGKAAELQAAVKKAYTRACHNLFPIPRYNGHTIPEGTEAKFGQVKMVLYPKCSGKGIVANDMIASICKLAGIHDIGVKIHGSRNRRNAVKCLFEAFSQIRTHEEMLSQEGKVVLSLPPGRWAWAKADRPQA